MNLPQVVIIELGSQYTLVIGRTLRELGYRSVIIEPDKVMNWVRANPPKAVILSGGAASVYGAEAPQPPEQLLTFCQENRVAILGICYGMQWLAQKLGGRVEPALLGQAEYGGALVRLNGLQVGLFMRTPHEQAVWMSHADSVVEIPEGFAVLAHSTSEAKTIAAIKKDLIWAVQFHPEVPQTDHGKTILSNFLRLAGCRPDWELASTVSVIQDKVRAEIGDNRVVFGFSGGVDSTTVAAVLAPVIGERLLAVTIDGGQLRQNELAEIEQHARVAGVTWQVINAHDQFAVVMADVTDAEEKRRRFKKIYASLLVEAAKTFGATFLLQGTLATDRIESGATGGALIKSHHNVGNDTGNLVQLHPIDHLFKYEIRDLAREFGLPESVWNRQPSPGPGLFIRVIGTPATPDKLEILRWATSQTEAILARHGWYDQISQLVVAYLGLDTVGVKGDGRVYGGSIGIRAVKTIDFMTAEGVYFPGGVAKEISATLTKHPSVIRVFFDATDKPPATTEFE